MRGKVDLTRRVLVPKPPKVRLVRKGNVLVASVPAAREKSVEEANDWIRRSRDREI